MAKNMSLDPIEKSVALLALYIRLRTEQLKKDIKVSKDLSQTMADFFEDFEELFIDIDSNEVYKQVKGEYTREQVMSENVAFSPVLTEIHPGLIKVQEEQVQGEQQIFRDALELLLNSTYHYDLPARLRAMCDLLTYTLQPKSPLDLLPLVYQS